MKSYIHKFFKHSHVTISIQDLFFILIILQKISNNSNNYLILIYNKWVLLIIYLIQTLDIIANQK